LKLENVDKKLGSIDNTGATAQSQFIVLVRVRTAPPVSVRVRNRVSVSFSFVSFSFTIYHAPGVVHVNPYRHSAPYSQCVPKNFVDDVKERSSIN